MINQAIEYAKSKNVKIIQLTTNIQRPRQLLRLKKFIELANKHNSLPHIKLMAEAVFVELNKKWLDVKPMEYYPTFR